MTPSSHPRHSNPRLRLLRHTPGSDRVRGGDGIDSTPVAGPSSAISSETPAARLRALLAHPSSSPSGRYPPTRPGRNNFSMSETDGNPVVDRARFRCKGKRKSLGDDNRPISSSLSSLLRNSGSPIQIRAPAVLFQSVPDFPLKSFKSEGEVRQTMSPSSTPYGITPLISSAPQDSPEVETHRVNVTPSFPVTPASLKHAPTRRATSPPPASPPELTLTASSWMSLSRANSETKRRLMPETSAGNDLCTTTYPLSHAKSLHVRTPAPPGAWMSAATLNLFNTQSNFGSIRGSIGKKRHPLKVRFDVAESEASTAEVEQNMPLVTDMRMPAPDSLPDSGRVSRSENVPRTRTNDFSQADPVNDLVDRPVTPGRHMTPVSLAGAPSSRPLRKAFSVKFVDAFGRERSDEISEPIANGHAGAGDATRALPSAKARTPRISSKNKICVINATGKEVQEDVPERSSVLYDDPSSCHTATLAQIRRTLRTWAGGLSDEDRPLDNLPLKPSDPKELEELSSAARRLRHQLARNLRIESVKECCERDLMHKYTKGAEDRSELLPIITGDNGSSQRDLVWVGVLLQFVFILAMWQFAHVQARHLFYAVYYEPLYPDLNPRISRRIWERWTERPDAESWPPT
ncbi:hypothetical protein CY34DRAFT_316384 [Suillus luteus UH-Slu-Lm8-n1]|uniref:Unplaced genomic scaffold CY34scaffold_2, whole genome shotgun sequence n=1 Tax=Suillus luteus UH-Slu-Lm8-n1 TaxID=930992 RepID=A0A0D0AGZ1_9AGAM|nr:hypothetical protein CY34DRAFT_316384 [Suillus luteus UH-Slu-Lm8-n1]